MAGQDSEEYSEEFESGTDTRALSSPTGKKKGIKKRPKSASSSPYSMNSSKIGKKSGRKSATEMWINTVQTTSRRNKTGNTKNKTASEYWTETLRKSGHGLSGQTKKSGFSNLDKSLSNDMAYGSTSHYLRQVIGIEKTANGVDRNSKLASGKPAYKTPEEYYDDIITLKKQIKILIEENSVYKSRMRRLEEENAKKEKEIDQLLNPNKNDDIRRTLGDRKPDSAAVIYSMKQKVFKLEQQLREREAALNKIQSDLKTTKIEELQIQVKAYLDEIKRLQTVKAIPVRITDSPVQKNDSKQISQLKKAVHKMNENNFKLKQENSGLKKDLEKFLSGETSSRRKKDKRRAGAIDNDIVDGKIDLHGTMEQRLDILDNRETELLQQIKKHQETIKRLRDDVAHYKDKYTDKFNECKDLTLRMENDYSQKKSPGRPSSARTPRNQSPRVSHRSTSSRPISARRPSSGSSRRSDSEEDRVMRIKKRHAARVIENKYIDYRRGKKRRDEENEAAEVLQSTMRGHLIRKQNLRKRHSYSDDDDDDSDDDYRNTVASQRNQRSYKGTSSRRKSKYDDEDDNDSESLEESTEFLQTTFRGYQKNREQLKYARTELDSDYENNVEFLQSTLKGHLNRKKTISNRYFLKI